MIKRGDIFYADLSPAVGSEQNGLRPVLIIQNDIGNKFSPTVIAICITAQKEKTMKKTQQTHVYLDTEKYKNMRESVITTEQFRTIDKDRLDYKKLCSLDEEDLLRVEKAIFVSLGISSSNAQAMCV